ncbi:hypothetical protein PLESTB_000038500 [Pleodorina starrii]|uniref:AAA+ ATPase domain-containing protein n=1 Tax=Pleodorina starrii TaxID=330485 RepID=A0A9W6EWJ6_9CHLO|nr:hypothetical protein PLESTM_001094700 [Pleodorina starrii]GLC47907.1 hypothetical protein PLESTB_000038500 [Pleodorina starrii]GLC70660.1 hypothetical protein PLESTF_001019100 [Pleodorina starrii]
MSSKHHIFLTGTPGVGKSTLCQKALQQAVEKGWHCAGFYTEERRDDRGERCGFDVVTLDGLHGPLARVSMGRGPRVGKYSVDLASFERLALPALSVLKQGPPTLVLIDEIGAMELFCRPFFPAVRAVLDAPNVVVLGTIPLPKEGRVFREVAEVSARPDVEVLTVTRANRDVLVSEVVAKLQASLLRSAQRATAL